MAAGASWLLVLFVDVFGTVFVPRRGPGLVTGLVYRSAWALYKRLTAAVPRRFRRPVLAVGGPLLLPLTVSLWVGQLLTAFTLIYLPFSSTFSLPEDSGGSPGLITALYYSGYSAATLGVGDIFATTGPLRMLGVLEAMLGFSLFSVSITYLLSVYGVLTSTTSLAREISRFTHHAGTIDSLDTIIEILRADAEDQLVDWLLQTSSALQRVAQGEAQYPVLHYFHFAEDDSALPMSLPDLLEILTVIRAVFDPDACPALARGPVVIAAYDSAVRYEQERLFVLGVRIEDSEGQQAYREATYRNTYRRLVEAGVAVRDHGVAHGRYVDLRSRWDSANTAVRAHFGYPDLS